MKVYKYNVVCVFHVQPHRYVLYHNIITYLIISFLSPGKKLVKIENPIPSFDTVLFAYQLMSLPPFVGIALTLCCM